MWDKGATTNCVSATEDGRRCDKTYEQYRRTQCLLPFFRSVLLSFCVFLSVSLSVFLSVTVRLPLWSFSFLSLFVFLSVTLGPSSSVHLPFRHSLSVFLSVTMSVFHYVTLCPSSFLSISVRLSFCHYVSLPPSFFLSPSPTFLPLVHHLDPPDAGAQRQRKIGFMVKQLDAFLNLVSPVGKPEETNEDMNAFPNKWMKSRTKR